LFVALYGAMFVFVKYNSSL